MEFETLKVKKKKLQEEINTKEKTKNKENLKFYEGYEKGIEQSFNLFEKFIELYKKYQNNVKLLMNEENKVWKNWVKYYENKSDINTDNYLEKYNDWLFDYFFSNINEDTEKLLSL